MNPELSILIATRNNWELTRACLASLAKTLSQDQLAHEIIIVDDCSDDGTRVGLSTVGDPRLRLLFNETPGSFAKNNNAAAKVARGRYLCLLNNDTVLKPGWWQPILAAFSRLDKAGLIGNVQYRPKTRRLDHLGVVFSPDGIPEHFGRYFPCNPFKYDYREWSAVTAACVMVQSEVFLGCGGFREIYVNGMEDMDLCLRLRREGYRHFVANQSRIVHVKSASPGRHEHDRRNLGLFLKEWATEIAANEGVRDRRLFGLNYLYRFACYPWSCRADRLKLAARSLL
jgi:GT2 family glycosyltransferase